MKDWIKRFWNARLPVHNRVTVGLGILCLFIAVGLTVVYYAGK